MIEGELHYIKHESYQRNERQSLTELSDLHNSRDIEGSCLASHVILSQFSELVMRGQNPKHEYPTV
jgi:hypothetical protein